MLQYYHLHIFIPVMGFSQSLIPWVMEVKQLGHEVNHLPPSSAKVKICGATSPPPHVWHGV